MHWNVRWISPGIGDCRWFWFPFNTAWLFWIFLSTQAFYLVKKKKNPTRMLIVGRKEGGLEQGGNKGCVLGSEWFFRLETLESQDFVSLRVQGGELSLLSGVDACMAVWGWSRWVFARLTFRQSTRRLVWDGTQTPGTPGLFLVDVQLEHVCGIALEE